MNERAHRSMKLVGRTSAAFVSALNSAGSALIFGLVLLINLDIIARFVFNAPISGVTEIVELSIVAIVFLQISDAVREGKLTRSDGLYSRLCSRYPRAGHVLGAMFDFAGAMFFSTIVAGGIPRLIDSWQRDYFSGIAGVFTVPVWPVRLVLVIGSLTAVAVFLVLAMRHLKALTR